MSRDLKKRGNDCIWKFLGAWPLRLEAVLLFLTLLDIALSGVDASRLKKQGDKPSGASYLNIEAQAAYFTTPCVTIALIILNSGLHYLGCLHPAWSVAISTIFCCGWATQAAIIYTAVDRPERMNNNLTIGILAISIVIGVIYGLYLVISSVALHHLRQSKLLAETSKSGGDNFVPGGRRAKQQQAWGPYRHASIPIEAATLLLAIVTLSLGIAVIFRSWEHYNDRGSHTGTYEMIPLAVTVPSITIVVNIINMSLWAAGKLSPVYAVCMSVILLLCWVAHGTTTLLVEGIMIDFVDPGLPTASFTFAFLPIVCYIVYMSIAAAAIDRTRRARKLKSSMVNINNHKLGSDGD